MKEWQKFKRWQWISYNFVTSPNDRRKESQKVDSDSLRILGEVKRSERTSFLNPLIREAFRDAEEKEESLTLLRPREIDFRWKAKAAAAIDVEKRKHSALANQLSWLDETAKALEPCPYQFRLRWVDQSGKPHNHECDDWESVGAFWNFRRLYGEEKALTTLKSKYEADYFSRGLALAFSTHKRRNFTNSATTQWLLVGLIRLDESKQADLFIG